MFIIELCSKPLISNMPKNLDDYLTILYLLHTSGKPSKKKKFDICHRPGGSYLNNINPDLQVQQAAPHIGGNETADAATK